MSAEFISIIPKKDKKADKAEELKVLKMLDKSVYTLPKSEYKCIRKELGISKDCKSKCCEKFQKREDKRCKKCPMLDLIQKRVDTHTKASA